jgi:hypothetical protein
MLKNWRAAGALGLALGLMVGMPTAQAVPIGDAGNGDAHVILVYGGCGPYGHRGPYGGCQPGGQWGGGGIRPFYGPFGGAYCPPGYHLGPYRHACWPSV